MIGQLRSLRGRRFEPNRLLLAWRVRGRTTTKVAAQIDKRRLEPPVDLAIEVEGAADNRRGAERRRSAEAGNARTGAVLDAGAVELDAGGFADRRPGTAIVPNEQVSIGSVAVQPSTPS